jgi:tetratricopeptide (TPR) repeat protein
MRIFISYARADASEFAERVRVFCAARGHDAWLDIEGGIQTGERYDVAIERGLQNADAVVSILTPAAVRAGGFCRNEIAYALDQGKLLVPIRYLACQTPVQIYTLQQLDYVERGDAIFDDLARRLENSRKGEPPLPPGRAIDFTREVARFARDFTPRPWLSDRIRTALCGEDDCGVLITGLPGTGKSAYLGHLAVSSEEAGVVHLCRTNNQPTLDPRQFVLSLATQLSSRLPSYASVIGGALSSPAPRVAGDMLLDLVLEPLRGLSAPPGATWVLVDAIDEAGADASDSILETVVAAVQDAPPWLKFVCSSRPNPRVWRRLSQFNHVSLEAAPAETAADIRRYVLAHVSPSLQRRLAERGLTPDNLAERLARRASGSFLYARSALREFGRPGVRDFDSLPSDIEMLYVRLFRERFPRIEEYRAKVAPVLSLLSSALEPLRPPTIAGFLGWDSLAVRQVLGQLEGLLDETGETVVLGQRALGDWLAEASLSVEYCLPRAHAHASFARICRDWERFVTQGIRYPLRFGPTHFLLAGDTGSARAILLDRRYREEFARSYGTEEWSHHLDEIIESAGAAFASALGAEVDTAADAQFAADLGLVAFRRDRMPEARHLFDSAIRHAEAAGQWDLLAESLARRGWVESSLGHVAAAEDWYRRCRDVAREHDSDAGLMTAYQHFARMYLRKDRIAEARKCYEQVIELARRLDRPERQISALCGLADLLIRQRRIAEALTATEEAAALARRSQSGYHVMVARTLWARAAMADSDRTDAEAVAALEEALRIAETRRTARGAGEATLLLGMIAARRGDADRARDLLERSVRNMAEAGPRFVQAPLEQLVPLTSEGDRYEDAIADMRRVSAVAPCPTHDMLRAMAERQHRETVNAVTLAAWHLPEASALLDTAGAVASACAGVEIALTAPEALHLTVVPLKRYGRQFSSYPPPLSKVVAFCSTCPDIALTSAGAVISPAGALVLLAQPENQALAKVRTGVRLVFPDADDTALRYVPHLTLGYLTHVASEDALAHLRVRLSRAFDPNPVRLVIHELRLVHYSRRTLESVRGEFACPLSGAVGDERGSASSDAAISDALRLRSQHEGLLDDL